MQSSDVRIESAGCALAATYAEVADPVAAALLIPGSGRTDRNSDVRLPLGQRLRGDITRALAQALGSVGASSLRFDKRGVGASGGDYLSTGWTSGSLTSARPATGSPPRPRASLCSP